jgi:hypothetical protein
MGLFHAACDHNSPDVTSAISPNDHDCAFCVRVVSRRVTGRPWSPTCTRGSLPVGVVPLLALSIHVPLCKATTSVFERKGKHPSASTTCSLSDANHGRVRDLRLQGSFLESAFALSSKDTCGDAFYAISSLSIHALPYTSTRPPFQSRTSHTVPSREHSSFDATPSQAAGSQSEGSCPWLPSARRNKGILPHGFYDVFWLAIHGRSCTSTRRSCRSWRLRRSASTAHFSLDATPWQVGGLESEDSCLHTSFSPRSKGTRSLCSDCLCWLAIHDLCDISTTPSCSISKLHRSVSAAHSLWGATAWRESCSLFRV